MKTIIKDRGELENIEQVLKRFVSDKKIYVPFLYDGYFETTLSDNNVVSCRPGDKKFECLWSTLQENPASLSTMLENLILAEEYEANYSEVLKAQKGALPISFTLMNMCKRSDDRNLLGALSKERGEVFNPDFLLSLSDYKLPFDLVLSPQQECFMFQDLTYLSSDEITTLNPKHNFIFVTNNKQHLFFFDGENCLAVEDHFLIWR